MVKLKNTWRNIWNDDGSTRRLNPFILFLFFLSLLYRQTIKLRDRLYDTGVFKERRLPGKVISVGNITVGGTGKTTMVIMLTNMLKKHGYRPAILSRGYGGKKKTPVNVVSNGAHLLMGYVEAGDEPVLLAKSVRGVPVLTGPKRTLTGRFAREALGADILILDDGFQHHSLFRDIDIVLLDAARPFGNGRLLPRGPLRESTEALKRADIIVWTGGDNGREEECGFGNTPQWPLHLSCPECDSAPVFRGYHRPKYLIQAAMGKTYPPEYLNGKKVCAFAGIGSPESFRKTLESLGGRVVAFIPFPDHHRYHRKDITVIRGTAAGSTVETIVTTEKDGIKLADFPSFLEEIFLLHVEMEIVPSGEAFETLILEKLEHGKLPLH
ncbi:MAG: tetraacyldisaccharide 4'-kinase [Syntrophales bacterium]|nr:tetraacyldisaccharide 4'-kinase [Syntrophales bacterium]